MTQPMTTDTPAAGRLLTRLPGRAKPRAEALKEFDELVEALKPRYDPGLWPLLIPKAEELYRWRMQLECGCVRELFTLGETTYLDLQSAQDPLTGERLPVGEYWCTEHRSEEAYRDIVEWGQREVKEFPADPEKPQHGMDPEIWSRLRHDKPHSTASWHVRLSCGHSAAVLTDLNFTPGDEPRRVSAERRDEMRCALEGTWATDGAEVAMTASPDTVCRSRSTPLGLWIEEKCPLPPTPVLSVLLLGELAVGVGETVGVGAGLDDGAAEGQAVDDGGAEPRVGERLGPPGEGLVRRDRH